MYKILATPMLT